MLAAHKTRVLNGTPLTETACIQGFLSGLRSEFDAAKLPWQSNVGQFGSLDDATAIVKSTSQNMLTTSKNNATLDPAPATTSEKRKTEFPGDENQPERPRKFRNFRRPNFEERYPSYNKTRHVLATIDDDDDFEEEETFTATQIQQLVRNAVSEQTILATMRNTYQPLQQSYQQWPPYMVDPQVFLAGKAPRQACRYFSSGMQCPYSINCRFVHELPTTAYSNSAAGGEPMNARSTTAPIKSASTSPPRVSNPFAPRGNT